MTAYVFMIVFWLAMYYWLIYVPQEIKEDFSGIEKHKKAYILFAGIALFVVMGLRHKYVGFDTMRYLERYRVSGRYEWSYFLDFGKWLKYELGFTLIGKILQTIGVGEQVYLILYALFISLCISLLVYRWCKNPFLGFYLHTTIGLFTMSMSGMRQSIACCICWLGIDYIFEKKPVSFFLLVLLASTFHQSAIFFLAFYFARYIKTNKISGWLLWLVCLSFVFLKTVFVTVFTYLLPEKYNIYGLVNDKYPVNPILVGVALLIPAFCLFFWEREKTIANEEEPLCSLCFCGSLLYAIITTLSLSSNMIGRMSQYFYIFNVILLGNIVSDISDYKTRYVVLLATILFPGYMFFKAHSLGISPYYFFWQTYGG